MKGTPVAECSAWITNLGLAHRTKKNSVFLLLPLINQVGLNTLPRNYSILCKKIAFKSQNQVTCQKGGGVGVGRGASARARSLWPHV